MSDTSSKILLSCFAGVGLLTTLASLGLLLAFPIKWTWNNTMPFLFGLQTITWGKAWCLHFLAGCLIKSSNVNTK